MVHDNIGGDDIDATQSRLVTPHGHFERFCREGFEFFFVLDFYDWKRVSELAGENTEETNSLGRCRE